MKEKFRLKWENFWYHYKFRFFVILFFLFAIAYTLLNHFTTEQPDLIVVYAGQRRDIPTLEAVLNERYASVLEDIDQDGKQMIRVKEINTTTENIKNDMIFWQAIDMQMISKENYLFILEEFVYYEFIDRKYIGEFTANGKTYNFADVSRHPDFQTPDWAIGNCYFTVRPLSPNEDNDPQIENGLLLLNKVIENY